MCQCLLCGCCWWNYCGVCCGGIHEAFCVCSYWLCKPQDLRLIDPECCHICACDGWGYNCCWYGIICCAPKSVMEWSGLMTAGMNAGMVGKQTVIINNTSPIMMNPDMSYQNTGRTDSGFGAGGVNVNSGYGYGGNPGQQPGYGSPGQNPQMQMQMNQGPQGANAKINF